MSAVPPKKRQLFSALHMLSNAVIDLEDNEYKVAVLRSRVAQQKKVIEEQQQRIRAAEHALEIMCELRSAKKQKQ